MTTSAGRLQQDVEAVTRANGLGRSSAFKTRVQQSKQAKWLRTGRRGTHVFILKVAERSRALDWYWELWRELGGGLPRRMDIVVPALSTTVRLNIPEDEDEVGSRRVCKELSPINTIKTCWDMMTGAMDVHAILEQQEDRGKELDLELAWKAVDGNLEWVAYGKTVMGQNRDWAVLAGVAKGNVSGSRNADLDEQRLIIWTVCR